ncbi:MAG: TonB C-terminal domain-containing protein [Myxococcota bacterium]
MRDVFSAPVEHEAEPRLMNALMASALLHVGLGVALAVFVIQMAVPVDEPLKVTWIEPIIPPKKMEPPGGSTGPAPEPAAKAPPKPAVKPKPRPKPVVVKKQPPRPVPIEPVAEVKAPVPPPPPADSVSARIAENEYVALSTLSGISSGKGSGSGRGRGGLLGDGVGSGIAPRRPIVYLSRSMYNPKRKDLEVYDKMFWHVVDHWEIPPAYRGRNDLIATVNVRFDREGRITKFKFIRKSGDHAYDDTVVQAVVSANPLPKPTKEFYQRFFDSGVDLVIEPKKIYFYEWPDPYKKKKGFMGF